MSSFTSNISTPFIYRPFLPEQDLPRLVALLTAVEREDQDGEDVSEAYVREQLTWSHHDAGRDRYVAFHLTEQSLLGHGAVFVTPGDEHADLSIVVHPAWRRQGLGSALLLLLLDRARSLGTQDVRSYAALHNSAAQSFLDKHAFVQVSTYTRMSIQAPLNIAAPVLPPGFVVSSYTEIQRPNLFTEAVNRCYEGLWGHRSMAQPEVEEWLTQLSPANLFLAFAPDGAVAGIVQAAPNAHLTELHGHPAGLIDAPGVTEPYRQTDLYLSLLQVALQHLASHNFTTIELESWGDTPETLAAYRYAGFLPIKEELSYRRQL